MSTEPATGARNGAEIPDKGAIHRGELHPNVIALERICKHVPTVGLALVVGLITFLVQGYRLNAAPDVFGDEGAYFRVADNLARGAGLVGQDNSIFFAHPPAFLLIEAAYIKLVGLAHTDPLNAVLSVRNLNVAASAITAALLVLFGRKLHSYKAGLVAAALFLMDPYVQRINRRNMLETFAMLCALIGVYVFFTFQPHLTKRQRIGAGLAFGFAMLTKEAMAFELVALIVYCVWFKRSQLRDAVWVIITSIAVYLLYPACAVAIGQGNDFLSVKWFQMSRIPLAIRGLFPGGPQSPYSSSAAHSLQNLLALLPQYQMSYVLIALSATVICVMIIRLRHREAVRYLIPWSMLSLFVGCALGIVSDQYLYWVFVPCFVVAGYVCGVLFEAAHHAPVSQASSPKGPRRPPFTWVSSINGYRFMQTATLAVLSILLFYNSYRWVENYVVGYDNAYIKAIEYVNDHVPTGETIVISEDMGMDMFLPAYNVSHDLDPKAIVAKHEIYFLLASKSVGYYSPARVTPEFYAWATRTSYPLFQEYDRSFWTVGVYLRAGS